MTTYTDPTHTTGGSRLAIIGGTVLTLAALASVVGWSLRTDQQGTEPAPVTTTSMQMPASAVAASEPAPTFMYLVDTPEDAAFVRQFLADLNGLRRELGQAPRSDTVIETTLDADGVAALPRSPGTTVYDLRQPTASGRSTQSGTRP